MCGIFGVVQQNEIINEDKLSSALDTLQHRGPDGKGVWLNSLKNVGFGHRRLSIIDLSENGKQPFVSEDENEILTFNGEIYNYLELKNELISNGVEFRTNSDTEVLLKSYTYWGKHCLSRFNGMFAFAIYDQKRQEIFCARDRFGEKPFYFINTNHQFIFSSEMKAIFHFLGSKSQLNKKSVYEFLLFSNLLNPLDKTQTFYKGVYSLPASSYIVFNIKEATLKTERYWKLEKKQIDISKEDAIGKFQFFLDESIRLRLRSDVSLGSSLSGGLDSSSIVYHITKAELRPSDFKTFSAVFPGFSKDESPNIKLLGQQLDLAQEFINPDPEQAIYNFEKLSYHQEEPFGSLSIYAQHEVFKRASETNTKVLLDGQGADEVLAGYVFYLSTILKQKLRSFQLKNFFDTKSRFKLIHSKEYLPSISLELIGESFFYNTYKKIGKVRRLLLKPDSPLFMGINAELVTSFSNLENPLTKPPNLKDHLKFSLFDRGLNELLRYADRNSMAHSVEVRLPFLDHKLVEFCFSLPDEFLISNMGWTKAILRESMNQKLPSQINWNNEKIGFEPPQKNWLKHELFKRKRKEAIIKLLDLKLIDKEVNGLDWKYISLGEFID